MVASEVSDAPRTFPRALTAALVLTTVTYALPLAACTAAMPPSSWPEWGEGQFEIVAKQVGGPLLQYILLATSVTAEVGVLCTLMCTTSRALVAMAQLRMLPGPLARLHPSLGTPYLAIALNSALIALATTLLHLEALLEITMFFYAVNVIVQCATVLRLRRTHPHRLRPSYTLPAPLLALPARAVCAAAARAHAGAWVARRSLPLPRLPPPLRHHPSRAPCARPQASSTALRTRYRRRGGTRRGGAALQRERPRQRA
jgi:amino acid transporter